MVLSSIGILSLEYLTLEELDKGAGARIGYRVAGLEELDSGVGNGYVAGNEVAAVSLGKVVAVVASGGLDLGVLAVASSSFYLFLGGKLSRAF